MKKITLICFGKLKSPGFEAAVGEFTKRLARYTDFQMIELKPIKLPEKSETLRASVPEQEGELLLSKIKPGAILWALDETGKSMKTTEWSNSLQTLADQGNSELVLAIGGSLGLGDNLLARAQKRISFGPQTLSHELARLVLVEQIYRSLSYLEGHPYHNEG